MLYCWGVCGHHLPATSPPAGWLESPGAPTLQLNSHSHPSEIHIEAAGKGGREASGDPGTFFPFRLSVLIFRGLEEVA